MNEHVRQGGLENDIEVKEEMTVALHKSCDEQTAWEAACRAQMAAQGEPEPTGPTEAEAAALRIEMAEDFEVPSEMRAVLEDSWSADERQEAECRAQLEIQDDFQGPAPRAEQA